MKVIVGTLALISLTACTSMPPESYEANHSAPRQVRRPSSDNSCESLRNTAPDCQLGDSYAGGCEPVASQDGARFQPRYECQKVNVDCTEGGQPSTVETLQYVTVGTVSCN